MQNDKNQTKNKMERGKLQCERILNAAEMCFIEDGFHSASMAKISKAAEMSAGLIYRYYESKNAIILAIIDRQLDSMRDDFANLQSGNDFIVLITDLFNNWKNGGHKGMNPALYLEIAAHASRDAQIRDAMNKFDRNGTEIFSNWLVKSAQAEGFEYDEAYIKKCSYFVKCFIDGTAVQVITAPNLELSFVVDSMKLLLSSMPHFKK